MDVDSTYATLATAVGALLVYILIAAGESALATISRTRLHLLDEQEVGGASSALRLLEDPNRLRASFALLRLLSVVVGTAAALVLASRFNLNEIVVAAAVWLGVLLLHALASAVGVRWYLSLAPALAPVVWGLTLLAAPLRSLLQTVQQRLAGTLEEDEAALRLDEEERRALASVVGDEEAVLPEEGREMIYNIVTLGQTTVREVMVPRPDIVALRSDVPMTEALGTIIHEGHSRIPVYEESIDNIIGILYAKDLLGYLRDERTDAPMRDMLRPAVFVPASKMADELLQDLQRRRVHLAIVFDEYGGTAGLVTIEDILEEIVGEIQDEYDEEEEAFHPINEYEAIVSGRLDIDDLNHEMDLALPTDENDTVGGLIYSALGRVPLLHDEVRLEEHGVTFRVTAMAGRRILKVHLTVDRPDTDDGSPDVEPSLDDVPATSPVASPSGSAGLGVTNLFFW